VGTADDVMSHPDVEAVGYVEVTGTEATMIIPDPNLFTGEVKITRAPAPAALDEDPEAAGSVRSPWWPRTSTPSQRRSSLTPGVRRLERCRSAGRHHRRR
jgi:hypothetical protein